VGVVAVTQAAIFLDRDGIINRSIMRHGRPHPPAQVEDLEILPGVDEALVRLKSAGFALIVVTNQPDIARGTQTKAAVDAINDRIAALLPLDEVRVCWHDDADQCSCRKPKPGLLIRPPVYNLPASVMIGDRWRDIEAGQRAGCRASVLVDYGYAEGHDISPDVRVSSLSQAADWILSTLVKP
jgi:D-glycero-D-manno-heptose 1,7-bisphosphate phosphatase